MFKIIVSSILIIASATICYSQSILGNQLPVNKAKGLAKTTALSYCSFLGMYIYAQDRNSEYLGCITDNSSSTESIINDNGNFGSKYSTKSIRNEYSNYGSQYSSYSAYNEYTSTPPIIYSYNSVTGKYTPEAYLTKNLNKIPAIDPDLLIATLKVGCSTPIPTTIVDLRVDSLSCYILGDSIRVRFIVYNAGNIDISLPFKADLYNNGLLLTYWNSTTTLNAGYFYVVTYAFKPTTQTNIIRAFIDYENQIPENYEFNNTLLKTIYVSLATDTIDVTVDSLQSLYINDTLWFKFNVLNNGNTPIPSGIKTAIYINDVLDITTDSTIDFLPPSYYYPNLYYIAKPSKSVMHLRICTDANTKIAEANENNNCSSDSIAIPITRSPHYSLKTNNNLQPVLTIRGNSIILNNNNLPLNIDIVDLKGSIINKYSIVNSNNNVIPLTSLFKCNGSYVCIVSKNGQPILRKTITIAK